MPRRLEYHDADDSATTCANLECVIARLLGAESMPQTEQGAEEGERFRAGAGLVNSVADAYDSCVASRSGGDVPGAQQLRSCAAVVPPTGGHPGRLPRARFPASLRRPDAGRGRDGRGL